MEPTISSPARRRPRRRVGLILGLVVALLAAPAIVLASHDFTDVPNTNPFHAQISRLVEAGITTGCTATTFCPKNNVTREQMAGFLSRGLGNTVGSYSELPIEDWAELYVNSLQVRAGGTTGGTGYITVTGDVSVIVTDPTLCPCGIEIGIDQLDGPGTSPQTVFVIPADDFEGVQANTGTIEWVFEVPSGLDAEFGLYANVLVQPVVLGEPVSAGTILGTMTAEYSPFGSTTVFGAKSEGPDVDGFGTGGADTQQPSVSR